MTVQKAQHKGIALHAYVLITKLSPPFHPSSKLFLKRTKCSCLVLQMIWSSNLTQKINKTMNNIHTTIQQNQEI